MKRKVAILLTILFISVGFRNIFTILYFYGNQAFIAKIHCVNKDKPEKSCKGKCYLSKQLEENDMERGEKPPLNRLFDYFEIKVLPNEGTAEILLMGRLAGAANWAFTTSLYQFEYSSTPFQPPEMILS